MAEQSKASPTACPDPATKKEDIAPHEESEKHRRMQWSPGRRYAAQVVDSRLYDVAMGIIILLNAAFIIFDTDLRASGAEDPVWKAPVNYIFLAIYIVDLVVRISTFRVEFFESKLNMLDFIVVALDLMSMALIVVVGDIPSFSILRVARLVKLVRCLRVMALSRELHMMLSGLASAMKAMFWAGIMLIVILTLWSIVAVEFLHPINVRLAERGIYHDCDRCPRAFSSVLNSNLTFLQQIVAGDSWGQVSIPIIEEAPATAGLFIAVMITINLGLLNLILTAIVDCAQNARDADVEQRLVEKKKEFQVAKVALLDLCAELDADESGTLTLDELLQGFRHNPEFAATMATMDVEERDMDVIFHLLDEDHSGTVSYAEFVDQLHKMKSQDTHTMLVFIKGYLNEVRLRMGEQMRIMQRDVRGDCQSLLKAVQRLTFGGDHEDHEDETVEVKKETSVKVHIEGATGLGGAEGRGVPYCVCEVVGKPCAKVQTPAVAECQDPTWDFKDSIAGYAPGDSLIFSVWDQSLDAGEALMGRAVLTSDQIIQADNIFDGELVLDSCQNQAACLRVRVANIDTPKRRGNRGSIYKADDMKCNNLTTIGDDIRSLSQQIDQELSQLKEDLLDQVSQQVSQLQEQISTSFWPVLPEDDLPPCPVSAGREVERSPGRGNSSTARNSSSSDERRALDIYASGCGALCAAGSASPSGPQNIPGRVPTSRV